MRVQCPVCNTHFKVADEVVTCQASDPHVYHLECLMLKASGQRHVSSSTIEQCSHCIAATKACKELEDFPLQ